MDTVMTQTLASFALAGPALDAGARAACDGFFRSFGFTSDEDLSRLAAWALDATVTEPQRALAHVRERMEAWLVATLGPAHAGSGRLLTRGRAAFVLCDGARWGARVITTPGALSLEQLRALRTAVPVPTPRAVPTTMPEQQVVLSPLGELLRRWWRAGAPDVSVSR
jgi:hypothetical protein